MIPLVNLQRQFQTIKQELMIEFEKVLDRGQYILGDRVKELEKCIARKMNTTHAVSVANGTDALVLTLDAHGIGPGDEVITTPFTFVATAESISRVGATPVFADIDPETYNLDPKDMEKRITSKTKAIIPVHLFGQPADMKEISAVAKEHQLFVIEDACQAFGATYHGAPVGSLGDAACFSFFPTKNLGTIGDGGIITTSNEQLANALRKLRHHGSDRKYIHSAIGYNSRLDEIHAAVLLIALDHIDEWNELRRKKANYYMEHLQHSPYRLPHEKSNRKHIYHLFNIEAEQRDEIIDTLSKKNIQSGIYYPRPLHLQTVYKHLGYKRGNFPVTEQISERIVAIPLSPFLEKEEQDQVISALLERRK